MLSPAGCRVWAVGGRLSPRSPACESMRVLKGEGRSARSRKRRGAPLQRKIAEGCFPHRRGVIFLTSVLLFCVLGVLLVSIEANEQPPAYAEFAGVICVALLFSFFGMTLGLPLIPQTVLALRGSHGVGPSSKELPHLVPRGLPGSCRRECPL